MSGYWHRTAARMVILSFEVRVRGHVENGRNSYQGTASLQVPLRSKDQLQAIAEEHVGQWRQRLWKGGALITTYEAITASHTARGWEVVS